MLILVIFHDLAVQHIRGCGDTSAEASLSRLASLRLLQPQVLAIKSPSVYPLSLIEQIGCFDTRTCLTLRYSAYFSYNLCY